MLSIDNVRYRLWVPDDEEKFSQFVIEHIKDIFGSDSEYFDLKRKIRSRGGIGSIPDGYVITFRGKPRWYVVELEISSHSLYDHMVPQLHKFISGLNNPKSRKGLVEAFYSLIDEEKVRRSRFEDKIGSGEVYRFISSLITDDDPTLVIVIDEKTRDLQDICETLSRSLETKVVEFKTFEREDVGLGVRAHLFEPLFKLERRITPARPPTRLPPGKILPITREVPEISREELRSLEDGEVVICPSKPQNIGFLVRHNAWGYVYISRRPKYFALYVAYPESRISFFGEVRRVISPRDPDSPVSEEEARRGGFYKEGKKIIDLKPGSLRRLKEGISIGSKRGKAPQGLRYVTLREFIDAQTLDDF